MTKTNYDNEMYHHGIGGQRWGDRHGPPYPLNPAKDYTAEQKRKNPGLVTAAKIASDTIRTVKTIDRKYKQYKQNKAYKKLEARKKEILSSGNLKDVYDNQKLFSNEELDKAIDRAKKLETLKTLTTPVSSKDKDFVAKKNLGYEKSKKIIEEAAFWTNKAGSIASDAYKLYENGRKAYNVYAELKNTGSLKTYTGNHKILGDPNKNKDKKKDDDD